MKKIRSKSMAVTIILVLLFQITALPIAYSEKYDSEYPIAEAVFGENIEIKNIKCLGWGERGDYAERLVRDGRECIRLNKDNSKTTSVLFDIDDNIVFEPEENKIAIQVDYFDEGKGSFTITYDGTEKTETDGEIVWLTNSRQWKTHTFYLHDARFTNRLNVSGGQWDFRIGEQSRSMGVTTEDVILGAIRVSEDYYPNTVSAVMNFQEKHTGNIFDVSDCKDVKLSMENNLKAEKNAIVEYSVIDAAGNVVETDKFNMEFKSREKKDMILKLKNNKKGAFILDVKITAEDENGNNDTNEISTEFSVMDKYKEGELLNYSLGYSGHISFGCDPVVTSEIVRAAGMGIWRDEYRWDQVEQQKNSLEKIDALDRFLKQYNREGIENLIIANYGNLLYEGNHTFTAPSTDENIAAYARYAAWLAREYRDEISAIEIWNEYNWPGFNQGGADVENYVKMLKACYEAIKQEAPEMKVVGIVSADIDIDFIREVFELGGYEYMDVVSTHPYDKFTKQGFDDQKWVRDIKEIKDLMEQYGGGKELWFTEVGWATYIESDGEYHITEEQQAKYLTRIYMHSKANGFGEKIYMYDFEDDGLEDTNSEARYGAVRSNRDYPLPYAAKPAIPAICAMNRLIANSDYTDSVYFNELTSAHRFTDKDSGEQVISIWSSGEDNVALNLGTDEIEIIDLYGNTIEKATSKDGTYYFILNDSQYYIKGDFKAFVEEKSDVTADCGEPVKNDIFTIDFYDAKKRDLKIKIETDDAFTVEKNEGIKNGKGQVTLRASGEPEELHDILVKAYDGDTVVFMSNYSKKINSPVECEIQWVMSDKSQRRFRVNNIIHNRSDDHTVSGSCRIIAPRDLAQNSKKTRFYNIRPGDTATVPINLPEQFGIRKRNITVLYEFDDGLSFEKTESIETVISAAKAERPPVIDGVMEKNEWSGDIFDASLYEEAYFTSGEWGGPDDVSFKGQIMYDDENLYLAFNVKDDVFVNQKTDWHIWNGDCVQIGIKDLRDELKSKNTVLFTEIGIALSKTGPTLWRYNSCYSLPSGNIDKAEAAIVRNGQNTIYEIKIPISEIFESGYKIEENQKVLFSVVVHDADVKDRRGWIEFNSGIAFSKDSSLFGTLQFTE